MKPLRLALAVFLAGGCATKIAQNYPSRETALARTYVHNLGFKGLFASEVTQSVSTRADMRRSEDQFGFTGFVMKHLAKTRDTARIWRVDKKLLWDLDIPAKTYTECPLSGCASPAKAPADRPAASAPQERARKKPSCRLTLAKNTFSVKATAQTRVVNGFDTKEYQISWDVVAQDQDKNKTTSTVDIDVWTTPEDDPRIKAVQAVDREFESALRIQRPEESRMAKVVPADALKVLEMQFIRDFGAEQRASLLNAGKELGKIHGYPISTTLNWYLDGTACQAVSPEPEKKEESPSGLDLSHGFSGLLGGAAQKGAEDKVRDMSAKPVFGFVQEVQEMKMDQASDGLFVVPPDFKLVDRR
ncbi:MAG: hypothetical protein ACHQ49_12585 [Elusimicrobiota bacterium]